ncbi:hypothetical protein [Streptomyces sp. NPDC018711]|uniref:hypothetical protein n=1 Tax=Streptomyces sp. NPDC018711 TaxID=3365052 RepID=UPI0037AAA44C
MPDELRLPDELRDGEAGRALRAALSGERGVGDDGVTGGGTEGERGALAAFRAARDEGLHASLPTRDRDDWTPAVERRRPRRSLKAAVAALAASVTLGGVAVATGGLPGHVLDTPAPGPRPTPSASGRAHEPTGAGAAAGGEDGASRSAPPDATVPRRPDEDLRELPGNSRDALCHAFGEKSGEKSGEKEEGKASKSVAWQRLVAAAGGEELVPEYCGYASAPASTPSAGSHPGEDAGRNASSGRSGRGPGRSHVDRP